MFIYYKIYVIFGLNYCRIVKIVSGLLKQIILNEHDL
jgi:hypothetical protein